MNQDSPDNSPERMIAGDLRDAIGAYANSDTVLNEAEFGYRYLQGYLQRLAPGTRVLEVGSGPCVLLSQIGQDFPGLDITGIEPIGPGFDNFEDTLQTLTDRYGFNLVKAGYETFADPGPFDLIFLVNVFEHLPDWRHFLGFVRERLSPNGKCIILCPNYGFPYESHFSLPIVFNKRITHSIFAKNINRMELEHQVRGLWDSLNFVKLSAVRKQLPANGLEAGFNAGMLREMIERLDYDPAFAARQRKVAFLARTALTLGIVRLLELPVFHRFHPYMHLEISHRAVAG